MILGKKAALWRKRTTLCSKKAALCSTRTALCLALMASLVPLGISYTRPAQALIVERVVAIVGEDAILLSDLKERALPYLLRIYASIPEGPARAANISQLYRMVLSTMVDEELEFDAARKAGVEITEEQVDDAIKNTAAQNGISVNEILVEAKRSGLSEKNYREELRRQLIQRSMMEIRLRGRINVTESDLRGAYRKLAIEERMQQPQRLLALYLPLGQTEEQREEKRQLAIAVSERAKSGEDMRTLVETYSTSSASGLRPQLPPAQEPKEIQRASMALDVGETSAPIQYQGQWLILQVIERPESELPTYTEARSQIHERVYMEKLGAARQNWLEGLRRRTHVELRL